MWARAVLSAGFVIILLSGNVFAGPYQDGWAAHNRGDYAHAVALWQSLADQGDSQSQLMLGLMYSQGKGVGKDVVEAHKWILISEASGNVFAGDLYKGAKNLHKVITPAQLEKAGKLAKAWLARHRK